MLSNPLELIPFLNKKLFKQGDCYSPGTGFCVKKDFKVYLAPADLSIDLLEKEDVFVFNEMLDENGQPSVHQAPENKDFTVSTYSKIYLHLLEEFSCGCVLICQTQPSTLIGDFYCDKVVFSQREWLSNFPVRFGACQDKLKFDDKLQIPIIQYKPDQDELISDIIDALYSNMPTSACIVKGFGLVVLGDSWMSVRNMFQILKELFQIELNSLQYRVRGSINHEVTKMSHQITELATSNRNKVIKEERDSQLASINHQELFREYLISPDASEIDDQSEQNLQIENDISIENEVDKQISCTKNLSSKNKSAEKCKEPQENSKKSVTNPPKSLTAESSKGINAEAITSVKKEDAANGVKNQNNIEIEDLEKVSDFTDGEEVMEQLIETVQQMENEVLVDYCQLDDCADKSIFNSIKYEPDQLNSYRYYLLKLIAYKGNIKVFRYPVNTNKVPFEKKRICYLLNCINTIGKRGMFFNHDLNAVLDKTRKTFGCKKCKTCKGVSVKDTSPNTTIDKDDLETENHTNRYYRSLKEPPKKDKINFTKIEDCAIADKIFIPNNLQFLIRAQRTLEMILNYGEHASLLTEKPIRRTVMLQYLFKCLDAIAPDPEYRIRGTSIESIKVWVRSWYPCNRCATCRGLYNKNKTYKLDTFELRIVSLVTDQNMTPKDVGAQHGINEKTIIKWVNMAKKGQNNPAESYSDTQETANPIFVEVDRQFVDNSFSAFSDNTGPYFEQATSQSLNHSSIEPKVRRFSDGNDQHLTGNSKQYAKEEIKFETENFRTKFSHLKSPKELNQAIRAEKQNLAVERAAREAVLAYIDNSPLPHSQLTKGSIKCMKILAQIEKYVSKMDISQEFKDKAVDFFKNIYGFDQDKMSRLQEQKCDHEMSERQRGIKRKMDQTSGQQNEPRRSKLTEQEDSSSRISSASSWVVDY